MQKPIFIEKPHCFQQKLFSWPVKKPFFFHLSDIRGSGNSFSQEKSFSKEFFIPASGNEFSVSQKPHCLFRVLSKILNLGLATFFLKKLIFDRGNCFFGQQNLIFFHFSDTPANERYFVSSGNIFFTQYGRDRLSVLRKLFLLFNLFFRQVETFTEISGNKVIWERLCSGRKRFSTQWNPLFSCKGKPSLKLVETSSSFFL